MEHELKINPEFYKPSLFGAKRFEVRNNRDRGFQTGDTIILKEYISKLGATHGYTGSSIKGKITYVTNYEQKSDFVVFGYEYLSHTPEHVA